MSHGAGPGHGVRRRGLALVAVLLGLLALTLAAHGALVLAREEAAAGRVGAALHGARAAAEHALTQSMENPPPADVPVGGAAPATAVRIGGSEVQVVGARLTRELWRIEATARSALPAPVAVRSAALAWALEPAARAAAAEAVLVLTPGAPLVQGGTVRGEDAWPGSGHPALRPSCARWGAALDSLGVASWPPVAWAPARLGHLDLDALARRLDSFEPPVVTPAPLSDGDECLAAASNWGDPEEPGSPCGERRVGLFAPSQLRVEGGVGQGLLVAAGDLTLAGGTRFRGLVLTGGTLTLEEGVRITGAARVGGGATLAPGAELVGSACAVAAALELDALRAPVAVPGGRPLEPR